MTQITIKNKEGKAVIRNYHLKKLLKDTSSSKGQLIRWINSITSNHSYISFPCHKEMYLGKYTFNTHWSFSEEGHITVKTNIFELWDIIRTDKTQLNKLIKFIRSVK